MAADPCTPSDCDLFIKNLPKELTDNDKEDLLQYFGARHVVCMGARGKLRNSVYATFNDATSAKQALGRLHQLEILGQKLVVEFAKSQHKVLASKERTRLSPRHEDLKKEDLQDSSKTNEPREKNVETPSDELSNTSKVSSKFGLNYPRSSCLHYIYPPPNVSIITNIANALICVPKFYVQVLHLMNKLNLPAPFGLVTATPPFPDEMTAAGGHITSSEESEIESDGEGKSAHKGTRKRPSTGMKPKLKRLRVQPSQLLQRAAPKLPRSKQKTVKSVFEEAVGVPQYSAKIGVKLADTISAIFEAGPQQLVVPEENKRADVDASKNSSGFGIFAPVNQEGEKPDVEEEQEEEEDEVDEGEFITVHELRRNRISREETRNLSAFKNYSSGEPTCRLYIKNLAKQVEIKDLRHVFGRFVSQETEEDKQSFDIRLMKEGRMKGQAFVSFPNEKSAEKALKETHRYLLFGKPLVVQFARSAKPKE